MKSETQERKLFVVGAGHICKQLSRKKIYKNLQVSPPFSPNSMHAQP